MGMLHVSCWRGEGQLAVMNYGRGGGIMLPFFKFFSKRISDGFVLISDFLVRLYRGNTGKPGPE